MEVVLWIAAGVGALIGLRVVLLVVRTYLVHRRNPHLREAAPYRDRAQALARYSASDAEWEAALEAYGELERIARAHPGEPALRLQQAVTLRRMCGRTRDPQIVQRLLPKLRALIEEDRSSDLVLEWCSFALDALSLHMSLHREMEEIHALASQARARRQQRARQ